MPTPAKKPAARKPAAKKPATKKAAAKKATAKKTTAKAAATKPAAKAAAAKKTAAKKATAAKKPAAKKPAAKKPAAGARKVATVTPKAVVDRTAGLSDDILKSLDRGQRAALEAVKTFAETVDEALPSRGGRPSQGEKVITAALEMAENLVKTQYDFLRTVVKSADRELTGGKKKQ